MTGVFSIAEAVESVFNPNKETIFFVIENGFDEFQIKSLKSVERIIFDHGGIIKNDGDNLEDLAKYINYMGE